MDALSQLLEVVRLCAGAFLQAELTEPWSIRAQVGPEDCPLPGQIPACLMAYHYVLDGRLWLGLDGQPPLAVGAGEIILLPRNPPHVLSSDPRLPAQRIEPLVQPALGGGLARLRHGGGGARTRLICGFIGCEVPDNPLLRLLPASLGLRVAPGTWIDLSFRRAVAEVAGQHPGSAAVLARLAELLFIEAVRSYLETLPETHSGWLAGLRDPQIGRALALLHGEPGRPWTTEALARAVGLSRSAFAARFTHLLEQPPMRYLCAWRLQLAARQLREGRGLARIATDVGYGSEAALNRAFRHHFGVPPATWRRQHSANPPLR